MSGISKAYQEAYNRIQDRVNQAIKKDGQKVILRYAAYEWDDDDMPIDNLSLVPIKGKVKFVDEGEFFDNYEPFESEVCDSPTYLEIAVIANKMIQVTKDFHHVFLERMDVYDDGSGVQEAIIIMGN